MGDIAGNQVTRHRNHSSMADGAIGINGDISGAAADIDHAHTQIFFIFG